MSTTTKPSPTTHPLELRVLQYAAVILLHLVIMALVAVPFAAALGSSGTAAAPREPFLIVAVGLLMAHCSLNGIWWARVTWPSYAKTLAAALSWLAIWVLLLAILPESRRDAMRAAGW